MRRSATFRSRNSTQRPCCSTPIEQAIQRRYEDFFICNVDGDHYETESFKSIAEYIEDPVMPRPGERFRRRRRTGITEARRQLPAARRPRYALSPGRRKEKTPPHATSATSH